MRPAGQCPDVVNPFVNPHRATSFFGIISAHFDFGIAAGYVNSGQRVYHGRGNSTAFLGLEGKTNVTVGTTSLGLLLEQKSCTLRLFVRRAGTYYVCGWLAAGYHFARLRGMLWISNRLRV